MTDREKFEAWFKDYTGVGVEEHPSSNIIELVWKGWQAALASQQPEENDLIKYLDKASLLVEDWPRWKQEGSDVTKFTNSTADNGWVKWAGGKCPVDDFTEVEYRTSQGSEEIQPAYNLRWTWNGGRTPRGGDIIAYRVVEDGECPELSEEDKENRILRVNFVVNLGK